MFTLPVLRGWQSLYIQQRFFNLIKKGFGTMEILELYDIDKDIKIDDLKEVDDEKLNALGVTDIESGNTAPRIRIVKESYILDAIYIVTVIATMGYNLNH